MMRGDAYRARALLALAKSTQIQALLKTNRQAQAQAWSHYTVMLHREESADASWPSLSTNQAHAQN